MLEKIHHPSEEILQTSGSSFKKITYGIVIGIFSYAVSYVVSIVIARVLGAKIFGDYAATISALLMIAGFSLLGADAGLGRFIPSYLKNQDYAGSGGYIRHYTKRILLIHAVIFTIGIMVSLILYYLTGEHILNIKSTHPFFFFIWGVPLLALFSYMLKFIRASGHGNAYLLLSGVLNPLLSLIVLGIFVLFIRAFTIPETLVVYFLAVFGSAVIALIFSYLKTKLATIKKQIPHYESVTWKPVVYQLFFLVISTSYGKTILLLAATAFDKDPKTAGFIAAVFTISSLIFVINSSIYAISGPKISVAVISKNKKEITSLLLNGVISNGLINGGIFLVILIWGDRWLLHFGSEFIEAHLMLIIVSGAIFMLTVASPLAWIFQQSGSLKEYTYFSFVNSVIYVIVCCLVAHFFGGFAAVIVYALMQASVIIYLLTLAARIWNKPEFMH